MFDWLILAALCVVVVGAFIIGRRKGRQAYQAAIAAAHAAGAAEARASATASVDVGGINVTIREGEEYYGSRSVHGARLVAGPDERGRALVHPSSPVALPRRAQDVDDHRALVVGLHDDRRAGVALDAALNGDYDFDGDDAA